jgi:hypothetical protein
MDARESPHVAEFEESLKEWTDDRFISRTEIRDLAMFSKYLVNLSESDGWVYCGHSFKVGLVMHTLTVKAYRNEAPLVVFTTGRTHTDCVRIFMRKLEADALEWREDKYRQ